MDSSGLTVIQAKSHFPQEASALALLGFSKVQALGQASVR
jgi:hypothetical protein